ncbi:MAG: peptide MFS transporter [Parvularculaceae bacterium]|nr:peptide MFS transporter [Parvularculaceae bacterium]
MTDTVQAAGGPAPAGSGGDKTWFGHPRQLAILFTSEMWERFGYYGMRALLILYLVEHFVFADRVANGLYGAFTSLVYLTPLIGGLIADQYFGSKKAVKLGAILMSAGYLLLAFSGGQKADPYVTIAGTEYRVEVVRDGETSTQYVVDGTNRYKISGNEDGSISLDGASGAVPPAVAPSDYKFDAKRNDLSVMLLFISLGLIIVGNGYFKPNISTIVGSLYPEGDRRRDAGFTIFYMGINLGSIISQFLAPLIVATTGNYMWGFALAGVGMLLAWARFQFAGPALADYGNPPKGAPNRDLFIVVGSLVAVPVAWFLLNNAMTSATVAHEVAAQGIIGYIASQPLLGKVMFFVYIVAMVGIPVWAIMSLKSVERDRMIVATVLTFFSVVFWTLFEQAGSSMTLFADRNTDRNIGTYLMPAGQVQIFNPLFIVIFAPIFSVMWNWLGKRGLEPSVPLKFAIGLILVGVGFLVLVFGSQFHDSNFMVPLFWLALAYFIHSIAELCLSPVGLSMITKLSIPKLVGMMMGVWFLSSAMAQYVGGIVAQFASTETVGGEVLNNEVSLNTYLGVFQTIGVWGVGFGVVLLVLWPFLKKGMHGVN